MDNLRDKNLCSVINCANTSNSKIFFPIPEDCNLAMEWLLNSGRKDLLFESLKNIHSHYKICEDHFERHMFKGSSYKKLKKSAIPTIFNVLGVSQDDNLGDLTIINVMGADDIQDNSVNNLRFESVDPVDSMEIQDVTLTENDNETKTSFATNEVDENSKSTSLLTTEKFMPEIKLDYKDVKEPLSEGNICRFCLQYNETLYPIQKLILVFEEHTTIKFEDVLYKYIPLKVDSNDCKPQSVCESCTQLLTQAHKFFQMCLSNDKAFNDVHAVIKSQISTPNSFECKHVLDNNIECDSSIKSEDTCIENCAGRKRSYAEANQENATQYVEITENDISSHGSSESPDTQNTNKYIEGNSRIQIQSEKSISSPVIEHNSTLLHQQEVNDPQSKQNTIKYNNLGDQLKHQNENDGCKYLMEYIKKYTNRYHKSQVKYNLIEPKETDSNQINNNSINSQLAHQEKNPKQFKVVETENECTNSQAKCKSKDPKEGNPNILPDNSSTNRRLKHQNKIYNVKDSNEFHSKAKSDGSTTCSSRKKQYKITKLNPSMPLKPKDILYIKDLLLNDITKDLKKSQNKETSKAFVAETNSSAQLNNQDKNWVLNDPRIHKIQQDSNKSNIGA